MACRELADAEPSEAEPPAPEPAAEDEGYTGSVYSMYMGLLVIFGIMWTIYFFLYAWQYESIGNPSFYLYSYVVSTPAHVRQQHAS